MLKIRGLKAEVVDGPTILRGIDPKVSGRVIQLPDFENTVTALEKRGNRPKSLPGIVLGEQLAVNMGVEEGGSVFLISPRGLISPVGHMPGMKRFKVVGKFESGMYEYDSSLAYIHIRDAQKILRMKDTVTGVEIRIKDIYDADNIGKRIEQELGPSYWTRDWMERNRNLFSAMKLEKIVMFIIMTLIVLVAAFNIASSLIMMVMDKTRDISILKAIGATDGIVGRIFVFKGMVIGFLGTILGTSLGILACALLERYKFIDLPSGVYGMDKLPVRLETLDVLMIDAAASAICLLATLSPARQAAGLNPVEAFRYG